MNVVFNSVQEDHLDWGGTEFTDSEILKPPKYSRLSDETNNEKWGLNKQNPEKRLEHLARGIAITDLH